MWRLNHPLKDLRPAATTSFPPPLSNSSFLRAPWLLHQWRCDGSFAHGPRPQAISVIPRDNVALRKQCAHAQRGSSHQARPHRVTSPPGVRTYSSGTHSGSHTPCTMMHELCNVHTHNPARTPHGRRNTVALPLGARAARPAPAGGRGLIKTLYLSLDPHARRWLSPEPGHFAPIEVGNVMRSFGLGVLVEASASSSLKAGNLVDELVSE